MADADGELKDGIRAVRATLRSVRGLERQIADIDAAPAQQREQRADERARLSAELRAARGGLAGQFDRLIDLASILVGTTVPHDVPRDGPVFASLPVPEAWDLVSALERLMAMERTRVEIEGRLRAMEQGGLDAPFKGTFARLLAPFGIHTGRQLARALVLIGNAAQCYGILMALVRAALYPEARSWASALYVAFMAATFLYTRYPAWRSAQ